MKIYNKVVATLFFLVFSSLSQAEYRVNLQEPVTEVARDIFGLHMLIFWICVAIFVSVFGVMFYSIFKHRKSKNFKPSQFSHSTTVEVIWTVIPFIILVVIAIPATRVLIKMEDTTKSDLTIKITGYQWKWGYEYLESGINFYSTLSTPREQINQFDKENAVELGEHYLLETDNVLVVPSGRKVRALITANDVIHAWWIPAFGTKKDAIPGYINELWFNVDEGKEGVYRGQCAELCGKDHAYMPIVVEVVTGGDFDKWVAAGGKFPEATNPIVIKEEKASPLVESGLTKAELMAQGERVVSSCTACHRNDGKGVAGAFPAIAGSPIVNGPIDQHIDIVMYGRRGTSMPAFASQLSDEQLAAVITYQRNAYGNKVGDFVQPSYIKSKRK